MRTKPGKGSPDTKGLQSQANARALVERLSGSEFRIPDMTLAEVERLTAKVLALYQVSGRAAQLSSGLEISKFASTIYDGLRKNDSSISARWVLDGILRELDALIVKRKDR